MKFKCNSLKPGGSTLWHIFKPYDKEEAQNDADFCKGDMFVIRWDRSERN